MGMVDIRKGDHATRVSQNAYETIFKPKGYQIVNGGQSANQNKFFSFDGFENDENNEPEKIEEVDIETIPVSDMNKEQLAEYAKKHNIDLTGVKNTREARQRVQKAMKESV